MDPILVGTLLALGTVALGRFARFDRDRVFYPVVLIVIASYYVLFAILGGSSRALWAESLAAAIFVAIAIAGFRFNLWWVAIASAGHGVFDTVHGHFVVNPGLPVYWPAFCITYDIVLGAAMAVLLARRLIQARPENPSGNPRA